jgi:hypothetical protein
MTGPAWRSLTACLLSLAALCGCSPFRYEAVPVQHVPPELLATSRSARELIDLTLLQQDPPREYLVDAGDVLGIYVENVLPVEVEAPVHFPAVPSARYEGQPSAPQVGTPVSVDARGAIQLPFLAPLPVAGLSLPQVREAIRQAYAAADILKPGAENILVGLIKARFSKVTVIREDDDRTNTIRRDSYVLSRRGHAHVLEMPAYENDLLHALTVTGGLPGDDAYAHVWILRPTTASGNLDVAERIQSQADLDQIARQCGTQLIKIPLRLLPGEPIPFTQDDIVLRNGDVVLVEARRDEFFYVGGYLDGAQVPLPRDYDLDILGAIALASGSVVGPTGKFPGLAAFRSGPGNIVPPTRAIVVRQYPDGQQVQIEVNLRKALRDPRERILIQPHDLILLKYTAPELAGNVALNLVNFVYRIDGN